MEEGADSVGTSQLLQNYLLSANELFKWRKKDNMPVPQHGGTKDFEPDGSWLQAKRLEAFYEEQQCVLAEPRVEKSGNLVTGTWNSELNLVNIEKTAKFWMKMGFVDHHRNWLYPEEALFLMEVNCLQVLYNGVTLSLQEAYLLFFTAASSISLQEYQVYAHLRRLGYVVIRHAGKLKSTAYERKIGIDKHAKKTKGKSVVKQKGPASNTESAQNIYEMQTVANIEESNAVKSIKEKSANTKMDPLSKSTSNHIEVNRVDVSADDLLKSTSNHIEVGRMDVSEDDHLKSTSNHIEVNRVDVPADDPLKSTSNHIEVVKSISNHTLSRTGESPVDPHLLKRSILDQVEDEISYVKPFGSTVSNIRSDLNKVVCNFETVSEKNNFGTNGKLTNTETLEPPMKRLKRNSETTETILEIFDKATLDPWTVATFQSLAAQKQNANKLKSSKFTTWDFNTIIFPNIAEDQAHLASASGLDLVLPTSTDADALFKDTIQSYKFAHHNHADQTPFTLKDKRNQDVSRHLEKLEFSYAAWVQRNLREIHAKNWAEWKDAVHQMLQGTFKKSPLVHFWNEEVTPLVRPEDASSTEALLKKISIIKPFQGNFEDYQSSQKLRIIFDVYLPNTCFKKTNPGVPDHRICVVRDEQPPNLFELRKVTAYLNDDVPLHLAVVCSGEVAFFVFEDYNLPVYKSSLG